MEQLVRPLFLFLDFPLLHLQLPFRHLQLKGEVHLRLEVVAHEDELPCHVVDWEVREIETLQLEVFHCLNSGRPDKQYGASVQIDDGHHLPAELEGLPVWVVCLLVGWGLRGEDERVVNTAADRVIGEGPYGTNEVEVVRHLFLSRDGSGKETRHGHSHVADGERRVENDVKWETDLKEVSRDGPAGVVECERRR